MNDDVFKKIGTRLPYNESDEYISSLVNRCADKALQSRPQKIRHTAIRRIWLSAASVAAVVAIALTATIYIIGTPAHVSHNTDTSAQQLSACNIESIEKSAPLNEVINEMSDDQLAIVAYYDTDDIPEY